MVIIWLPLAEKALVNIHLFYKEKSARAAAKIISDIRQATERLASQPEIGFKEPLLAKRPEIFRSLIVRKTYKVVYFRDDKTIYIADVWDCRQNPDNLQNRIT